MALGGGVGEALTALLVVVAIGCATVAVVAAQQRSDAQQRQGNSEAQIGEVGTELDTLRSQAADQEETLADLDTRAQQLKSMFTPDALTAITQVQAEAITGACDTSRTAARDGTPPPAGEQAAAYAATTAPAAHDALEGLPQRWGSMIDASALQAEIDRCAADEQAAIDAEAAAAAAVAAQSPPVDCAGETIDCVYDACIAGNQAACDGLAAERFTAADEPANRQGTVSSPH